MNSSLAPLPYGQSPRSLASRAIEDVETALAFSRSQGAFERDPAAELKAVAIGHMIVAMASLFDTLTAKDPRR